MYNHRRIDRWITRIKYSIHNRPTEICYKGAKRIKEEKRKSLPQMVEITEYLYIKGKSKAETLTSDLILEINNKPDNCSNIK